MRYQAYDDYSVAREHPCITIRYDRLKPSVDSCNDDVFRQLEILQRYVGAAHPFVNIEFHQFSLTLEQDR